MLWLPTKLCNVKIWRTTQMASALTFSVFHILHVSIFAVLGCSRSYTLIFLVCDFMCFMSVLLLDSASTTKGQAPGCWRKITWCRQFKVCPGNEVNELIPWHQNFPDITSVVVFLLCHSTCAWRLDVLHSVWCIRWATCSVIDRCCTGVHRCLLVSST